ncbi:MAG: hypothetical protein JWN15_2480 [Firmicutes bacterium]|nr:hypothetical protein [Bacillota bacterium]
MNGTYDAGPLFVLNHTWAKWMLIALGVGIALGLWRLLFRRPAQPYDPRTATIKRHAGGIALAHWINAVGFILALYSGASLVHVLPRSLSEVALYKLHYVGLSLILLSLLAVATHRFVYGGHSFRFTAADARAAFSELFVYAGLVGDEGILGFRALQWPAAWRRGTEKALGAHATHRTGKYLPTEQVLSLLPWIIVMGAIVATGLIKGLRYLVPIPRGVLGVATIIHDWGVYAGAFMLVVHVAALVVVRTNWPLFISMFTTRVPARYAAERHPAWYKDVVSKSRPQKAEEPAVRRV